MLGNSWHKKEKPFLGFNGYGGSAAGLVAARASASVEVSSDYLYIPFNENSTSRDMFGDYASSITMNSGGGNASQHPYSITDSTYNSGDAYTMHCNGESDTPYLSANTKVGAIGTGDICWDMYYQWVGEGNGGGSYGYVGDYARSSSQLYPSHTGISSVDNINVGAIGSNILARFSYDSTTVTFNSSLTTNGGDMSTWFHVLILRQSNKWYTFVDGVLDGYYAESSARDIDNGGGFHFGTIDRSGHWWNCYITDFMWQKGSDIFYNIDSGVGSGDIGTTYFAKPQYKNLLMAIPSDSDFSIVKAPSGFTTE